MDTNWCMFCGTHIDRPEDAVYCSDDCRRFDCRASWPGSSLGAPPSPGPEHYAPHSPMSSPGGSLVWGSQAAFRERSSSLTPMSAQDLQIRYPCHTPAYSSSRSSLVLMQLTPPFGSSPAGVRARSTSVASAPHHQLAAI
ncbi:hypothetical protein H4R18_002148 [Coemansia javaensis]|uniref:Uncharacterized protein n=1 Tax=Coemansia javaensis TaxID=2761396 RepID=A0A9W8HAJ7_9FUNG|nr:hypothetical protein H4R18_002148 [Coemansia javaensis]